MKGENKEFLMRCIIGVLIAIVLIISLVRVYLVAKEETYNSSWENKSYLVVNGINSISCDNTENVISSNYAFILIREENTNESEFDLEKGVLSILEESGLTDKFYVYTISEECGDISNDTLTYNSLNLNDDITKVPTILYYKDGVLVDSTEREDEQMITSADFQQLLDKYEYMR